MVGFVDDGPVGRGSACNAEEGGGGVGEGDFVRPVVGVLQTIDAGTPVNDRQGVLVGFAVEHWNFLLIDLHHWILGGGGDRGHGESSTRGTRDWVWCGCRGRACHDECFVSR